MASPTKKKKKKKSTRGPSKSPVNTVTVLTSTALSLWPGLSNFGQSIKKMCPGSEKPGIKSSSSIKILVGPSAYVPDFSGFLVGAKKIKLRFLYELIVVLKTRPKTPFFRITKRKESVLYDP